MSRSRIVDVRDSNIDICRFFCRQTKSETTGNRRKRDWLLDCFEEGLKLKLIVEAGRAVGFIEYAPAGASWRAVEADGYVVIHCIWVVGRWKSKGYGTRLLKNCVADARKSGAHGVAMVVSQDNWVANGKLLRKNGFESVDEAPPNFELLVKRFGQAIPPRFPTNWDARARRAGKGLTIFRTGQCPYTEDAVEKALRVAKELGVAARVVEFRSAKQARQRSPSAYGTYGVVLDGKLLTYHYEMDKRLRELLGGRRK